MLLNGTKLDHLMAEPHLEDRKIVSVPPLPCYGEDGLAVPRTAIDQALQNVTEGVKS
jgi:hypothetical protein